MIQIVRWVLLFAPIGAFAPLVPLAMHLERCRGAIAFYLAAVLRSVFTQGSP